jgi:phospholipid/cholesterol/gamma-HCH transport system permease protein
MAKPGARSPLNAIGDWIADFGGWLIDMIAGLGGMTRFSLRVFGWMFGRWPQWETFVPNAYQIGVRSLLVIGLTGVFIGMVLVEQSYVQFRNLHLEAKLGAVINLTLVRELGPVLAATMLAGRVGSAMAAELGTMRVTEQIDALASMGANPIHYLVVPRFLACLVLIPILTLFADCTGVLGALGYATWLKGIDRNQYMENAHNFVTNFDIFAGLFKSLFFGAAIALIACYRGFHCEPGAEGVGRAATDAFVHSFVMILLLDLLLGIALEGFYFTLWPEAPKLF